jgi:hypothetical protein
MVITADQLLDRACEAFHNASVERKNKQGFHSRFECPSVRRGGRECGGCVDGLVKWSGMLEEEREVARNFFRQIHAVYTTPEAVAALAAALPVTGDAS